MKTVALPSGETVPALGQGTWMIDHRDLVNIDLLTKAMLPIDAGKSSGAIMGTAQTA